jgi:hypothetical protein
MIQRARALATPDEALIRKRAQEIWEENGRAAGRDEEFWLQAEREFREAEKFQGRSLRRSSRPQLAVANSRAFLKALARSPS